MTRRTLALLCPAMLVCCGVGDCLALTIDLDFSTSDQANQLNFRTTNGYTPLAWQQGVGVGGSGGLAADRLHQAVYGQQGFDLAGSEDGVTVSTMFRTGVLEPVGAGSRETYGEIYLTDSPVGYPFQADIAFVEITRTQSVEGISAGPLQAGGGSFPGFSVDYPVGTLKSSNWYELKTTYTIESGILLGWDIEVNDYGADGQTFVETTMADQRTTADTRGFRFEDSLYAGFSAIGFGRVTAVDNFYVSDGSGDAEPVLKLSPSFDVKVIPVSFYSDTLSIVEGDTGVALGFGFNEDFPEERLLLEFPLGLVPEGAVVESANLTLDFSGSSGSPRIEVLGYEGDGLASLSDASPVGGEVVAISPPTSASTDFDEPLDVDFIQGLVDSGASHLGLRLRSIDLPLYVVALTSEAQFGNAPQLVITYSVPELAGDYNNDGLVDLADFTVIRDGLGSEYTIDDYHAWRENFGASSPGAATHADNAAPEPMGLLLAGLGVGVISAGRPGRRRSTAGPARSA